MSNFQPKGWSHTLTTALLMMAPFDLLASLAMDAYLPVVSEMPKALAANQETIQLTLSLYLVVLGLGQLVFGPLSDHFGRRPIVLSGAFLFASSSLGLSTTSSADLFLGLRVLQGIGASAMLVATFATVRDVYGERPESIVIYGLFSSMLAFVPALGPIVGALIAHVFGWRMIFTTMGLLAMAAYLHAFFRWSETRPTHLTQERLAFWKILSDQKFWTYTVGFSSAMGAFFVFFSTAPRILIERHGLSQIAFSLAFASVALIMVITARAAKPLISRWGVEGSFKRGMGVLILGAITLAVTQSFLGHMWWVYIASMDIIACGIVVTVSVTANGALERFPHIAGAATALYYAIQSLIVGILGTFVTFLLPGDTAWPLVAYCALMGSLSLALLARAR